MTETRYEIEAAWNADGESVKEFYDGDIDTVELADKLAREYSELDGTSVFIVSDEDESMALSQWFQGKSLHPDNNWRPERKK